MPDVHEHVLSLLFGADAGYIGGSTKSVTVSGSVATHLLSDSPVQVSLQAGFGWARQEVLTLSMTTLHVPVGIAIQATSLGKVRPWVMPRVSFSQYSGGAVASSRTQTDFGGSAGISYESGFGVGLTLAYDYLDTNVGTQQRLGAIIPYVVGN